MFLYKHAMKHPQVFTMTFGFSTLGYISVIFILALIKSFGSTTCEVVKSMRKILSILISMIAFSKPVYTMHYIGGAAFLISILMGIKVKSMKANAKKNATANENNSHVEKCVLIKD